MLSETIFVTGASGFIGKALIAKLLGTGTWKIRALTRQQVQPCAQGNPAQTWISGNLLDPASYEPFVDGVSTVVHLAALTHKSAPREYERMNVEATAKLLEVCRRLGVRHFLHISSIAVKYANQRHYPYARTKARAEALVRESGIASTIVRPTIVLGEGSPIWHTLLRIGRLPIIPLPDCGRARVQPVGICDLVRGLELVLSADRFKGEVFDFGGPAATSFAELMKLIHQAQFGRQPSIISLPLNPIRTMLSLIEPVTLRVLPVTAGQLTVFAEDSVVSPNWLHNTLAGSMEGIRKVISHLVSRKE